VAHDRESPTRTTTSSGGTGDAHIEVRDLVVQYGRVTAVRGVSFTVRPGEQVTLLGPSGCGKTTTLRAIAGLEPPTSGEIVIGGTAVFSSAKRINVSAERRGLSMVFQSYAIWPHMTVFDNVAYGLRVRRMGAREIAEKVRWALDMVQMEGFAQRSASKLSGGQQQRVALARAFVFSPSVLLFDEPLSNLDAKLRAEMRIELRELQHRVGITSVYVTHDLEEALAISDRIVVMCDGAIEQIGTPSEIYYFPRNAFVADFVGSANLIRGRHRPECGRDGLIALETPGGTLVYGAECGRAVASEGVFSVRPAHMRLSHEKPADQINTWPVRIRRCVFQGDFTQYHVDWEERQLVVRCATAEQFEEGEEAYLAVHSRHCILLEP
jgi:ABC-type Fe3+/spermidine/putrescine transport system ATPase subunit